MLQTYLHYDTIITLLIPVLLLFALKYVKAPIFATLIYILVILSTISLVYLQDAVILSSRELNTINNSGVYEYVNSTLIAVDLKMLLFEMLAVFIVSTYMLLNRITKSG